SAQVAAPVPEPTVAEPPRRRSTVREPAPQALRDEASPPAASFTPPAPSIEPEVSSSAESEDSDRPRRSGWGTKRAAGKGGPGGCLNSPSSRRRRAPAESCARVREARR